MYPAHQTLLQTNQFAAIGVGDGGGREAVAPPLPPPQKKNRENIFWAKIM